MPKLKIQWMGHPRQRLPRIRIASKSVVSSQNHSLVKVATETALRRPFSVFLRARNKQLVRFGRQRVRNSHCSSSAVRARKRATMRARQDIQVFGWGTHEADIASRSSKITLHPQDLTSSPMKPTACSPSSSTAGYTATESIVIESHDGSLASFGTKPIVENPDCISPSTQAVHESAYWRSTMPYNRAQSIGSPDRDSILPIITPVREQTPVNSLGTVNRKNLYQSPRHIARHRTYDPRIDPKGRTDVEREMNRASNPATQHTSKKTRKQKKSEVAIHPVLRKAVESLPSPSKENQVSALSIRSVIRTILSDTPSRTPSQRKALRHFTKEIELYLQATQSLPKKSLIASPTATTVSANTVNELKPYQAEFEAAGLAITSDKQRRKSPLMARLKKSVTPPPTPPKDSKWTSKKSSLGNVKVTNQPESNTQQTSLIPASPTITTVMGWTPPHEAAAGKHMSNGTSYTMSSDHTVIEFTPPHEEFRVQSKTSPISDVSPTSRSPTRKSLPWLQKPGTPRVGSYSPSISTITRSPSSQLKYMPSLEDTIVSSLIMNIPTTPKDSIDQTIISPRSKTQETEVQSNNVTSSDRDTSDYALNIMTLSYVDTSTQVNKKSPKDVEQFDERRCTEAVTQTVPACNRTAFIGPSKTIVGRKYTEKTSQTSLPTERMETLQPTIIQEQLFPMSVVQPVEHVPAFSFMTAAPKGAMLFRPFQATMALRSPHKGADQAPAAPIRKPPAPHERPKPGTYSEDTRETPIDRGKLRPVTVSSLSRYIEAEKSKPVQPYSQSDLHPNSAFRDGLNYICTDASSLECQQCSSEVDKPSADSTPDRKIAQKHSTDACIYESSPPLGQSTIECVEYCNLPDYQFLRQNVIAEMVAEYPNQPPIPDPIKQPATPKLRLRQASRRHIHPKRIEAKLSSPLPPLPTALDTSSTFSKTLTTSSSVTFSRADSKISDKDVMKGLHVVTAAACDKDADKWIEEVTGTGVRRFLADLGAFDSLGCNALSTTARKTAKQRSDQLRALEKSRRQRLERVEDFNGKRDDHLEKEEEKRGNSMDRKIGLMAGDESVDLRESSREAEEGARKNLNEQ